MNQHVIRMVRNIRSQARHLQPDRWDDLHAARLVDALGSARETANELGWPEASGRATELAARCAHAMQKNPPASSEVSYLATLTEGLADSLERQLAATLDTALMPSDPGNWTFVLLGEGLSDSAPTFAKLGLAGFKVVEVASREDFVARPEAGCPQAMVIADADWLVTNPLAAYSAGIGSAPVAMLVALADPARADLRVAALRSGARLTLARSVSAESLLNSLCGLAWQPAEAYRVMAVVDRGLTLELGETLVHSVDLEVAAEHDPVTALGLIEELDPEALLLDTDLPLCRDNELIRLLRQSSRLECLPLICVSAHADPASELAARRAGCDEYLVKPALVEVLRQAAAGAAARFRRIRQWQRLRREAEDILAQTRIAIDAHAIVSIAAADGSIRMVNDRFCTISGYRREELLGRNHRLLKSGVHGQEFYREMWRTIRAGRPWRGEICNRRKDGGDYWVEASIVPFLDGQGTPYQYVSIRTDITRLKQAQLALAEREHQLSEAQRIAGLGYWGLDSASGRLDWSDTVYAIHGVAPADYTPFIDSYYTTLIHPDDLARVRAEERDAYASGRRHSVDYRILCPDGSQKWVHVEGTALVDAVGRKTLSGMVQDITARKENEIALVAARDAAESASRAKSEFLASMSHELRTPLNAILGYTQLFQLNPQLPREMNGQVGEIERAGKHLLVLVNDLIDLARIESGKLELSMEPLQVRPVVESSLALVAPIAAKHGIELIGQLGADGAALVCADFGRLRQVIINLLSNAIKYNRPRGTVRIVCTLREERVRLSVIDIGPGIPLHKQARIFTAFDRLGEERGSLEGSGIGLNISRRIVEAMGGSIGFDSREGQGSTFWVEFPGVAGPNGRAAPETAAPSAADVVMVGATTTGRVVLHIEDNPMNQRLMRQIFKYREDLALREAHSAEIGIDLARTEAPALILMDIDLPGMDGYAALQVLRADPNLAHIPVIAVSANVMKGDMARGLSAGFAAYVSKPLDIPDFLAAIEALLPAEDGSPQGTAEDRRPPASAANGESPA